MKKNKIVMDTAEFIKKGWQKTGLIILFDILFILLLVKLRFVLANINTRLFISLYGSSGAAQIMAFLPLIVIESGLLILIYSFFKYIILGFIQEMFKKQELGFNRLFPFIKLNWAIGIPAILISFLFFISISAYMSGIVAKGVSNPVLLILNLVVISVIVLVLLVYLYSLLNLSHNIFLREKKLKKVLKEALAGSFKFRHYKIYGANIKIILSSLIILLVFYGLMKLFVLTDISAYLRYGGIYKNGLIAIGALTAYFLLLFNRINFYRNIVLVREKT